MVGIPNHFKKTKDLQNFVNYKPCSIGVSGY